MTVKEARKVLRDLKKERSIRSVKFGNSVENGYQIKCINGRYAVCGWIDNSDPMRDYCDWSFGWTEKSVLDMMLRRKTITA